MPLKAIFPKVHFSEPATEESIRAVEHHLGVPFPPALRELYLECDGFREPKGNAKYLRSLNNDDSIGSLLLTTRGFWADEDYWRSIGIDPTEFIFFGYSSADEIWGIRIAAPHDIIEYHHNQESEITRLGPDIQEVFLRDFQKYED